MEMWHVPADYAKNFNQILGLLIWNMVSKNVNLHCLTTNFILKKLEMSLPTKKITKLLKMLLVNQKYFV